MKTVLLTLFLASSMFAQFVSQTSAGLSVVGIYIPGAPTVTPAGTTGATTYTYKIVARTASQAYTAASAGGTATTGNATLSSTNYNVVTWTPVANAVSYDVYRTAGGSTQGKIAGNVSGPFINDTGLTGDSGTAPTIGNTAVFNSDGSIFNQTAPPTLQNGQCSFGYTNGTTTVTLTCKGTDGTSRTYAITIS